MKKNNGHRLFIAACAAVIAPLGMMCGAVHAEDFSDPSVAGYWVNKTFNAGGIEGFNAFGAPTVSSGALVSVIPTDTTSWSSSAGGGQGYEAVEHVGVSSQDAAAGAGTYYSGTLLGNLSGASGLTATFSVNNSAITAGATFTAGEFGAEGGGSTAPGIRLYIRDGNSSDPDVSYYPNEWFYTPSPALVTGLSNGVATTLTADFTNLSGWTDVDGHSASQSPEYTAAFETALSGVTELGLSFGSGEYYSDGFGFNTGGTATLNLDSINTTSVPEPASLSLLVLGGVALLKRRHARERGDGRKWKVEEAVIH